MIYLKENQKAALRKLESKEKGIVLGNVSTKFENLVDNGLADKIKGEGRQVTYKINLTGRTAIRTVNAVNSPHMGMFF